MRKSAILLFICSIILTAAPPSAEADRALRARMQEFYSLEVDHHFRQAEDFVAEDTKDHFYEMKKPDLRGFEIVNIEYAPDGKSATVSLRLKVVTMFVGVGPTVLNSLTQNTWKLEKGKWCWYVSKEALIQTPFGPSRALARPPSSNDPVAGLNTTTAAVMRSGAVLPDRRQVQLDAAHPAPEVINLKNLLPGPVTLQAVNPPQGITVTFGKTNLGPNESTTVSIAPEPGTKERPESVVIGVSPLKQVVPIGITWLPAR